MSCQLKKIPNFLLCENTEKYKARRNLTPQQIVNAAKKILANQVKKDVKLTGIVEVRDYLIVNYAGCKNETFICMYLDNQLGLIEFDEVFAGSHNCATVYPRVIAQRCLEVNASQVIFAHNHPSGDINPSYSDEDITRQLQETLQLVDVNVVDHIVIGGGCTYSFAAHEKL